MKLEAATPLNPKPTQLCTLPTKNLFSLVPKALGLTAQPAEELQGCATGMLYVVEFD